MERPAFWFWKCRGRFSPKMLFTVVGGGAGEGFYWPVLVHWDPFVEVASASAHQVEPCLLQRGSSLVDPWTAHRPHSLIPGGCPHLRQQDKLIRTGDGEFCHLSSWITNHECDRRASAVWPVVPLHCLPPLGQGSATVRKTNSVKFNCTYQMIFFTQIKHTTIKRFLF